MVYRAEVEIAGRKFCVGLLPRLMNQVTPEVPPGSCLLTLKHDYIKKPKQKESWHQ
jgi:hypothetical protein